MDTLAVALVTGVTGALTPFVAWLVFRQGNADLRTNLARDVELRKSLQTSDSEYVRELLRWNIEQNAGQLVHRERMRAHFARANRFFACAFAALAAGLILTNLAQLDALKHYSDVLALVGALTTVMGISAGLIAVVAAVLDTRATSKTRTNMETIAAQHPFELR